MPIELEPDPVAEPVKPGLPVELGGLVVWLVPAVSPALPLLLPVVLGGAPLAIEPHGRPIESVRPVLFSELAVDGLVVVGPDADGLVPVVPEVVGFAPVTPPGVVVAEPLMPADPLLAPDDAPAPPEAPPPAPPPPAAIASPALPARRIAAMKETE